MTELVTRAGIAAKCDRSRDIGSSTEHDCAAGADLVPSADLDGVLAVLADSDAGLAAPADLDVALANLARLFTRIARLSTGGESSSLSAAESAQLTQSILFVLGIERIDDPESVALLARDDLGSVFNQRRAALDERAREVMGLWEEVVATTPPIRNIALRDTLASVGSFSHRYDTFFAAHEVPCDIDYQLERPVSEGLQGVDYVEAWLTQALAEAQWLAQFEVASCVQVLSRVCPDYRGLLVNLCDLLRPYEDELTRLQ